MTSNDEATTARIRPAFDVLFGDRSNDLRLQTPGEDFSNILNALGVPYPYWGLGGINRETYRKAEVAGRVEQDIPVNHSALFAPVIPPTLDTGPRPSGPPPSPGWAW